MYLFKRDPARTPNKDERTSAREEPIKTYHIDFDFEASNIVESCVLSPSSAIKTRKNVVIIVFSTQILLYKINLVKIKYK